LIILSALVSSLLAAFVPYSIQVPLPVILVGGLLGATNIIDILNYIHDRQHQKWPISNKFKAGVLIIGVALMVLGLYCEYSKFYSGFAACDQTTILELAEKIDKLVQEFRNGKQFE